MAGFFYLLTIIFICYLIAGAYGEARVVQDHLDLECEDHSNFLWPPSWDDVECEPIDD